MLKLYGRDDLKEELNNLCNELEERIENDLDINEKLIQKADIIIYKIRSDLHNELNIYLYILVFFIILINLKKSF